MRVVLKGTEKTRTLYSVLYCFDVDGDDELCSNIDELKSNGDINPLNIPIRFVNDLLEYNATSVDDIIITKYRWCVIFE